MDKVSYQEFKEFLLSEIQEDFPNVELYIAIMEIMLLTLSWKPTHKIIEYNFVHMNYGKMIQALKLNPY